MKKKFPHDVTAHLPAFGDHCPLAKAIIHLGATSSFIIDNTNTIQIREGLAILLRKLDKVISQLAAFARKYAALPCLAYTHLPTSTTDYSRKKSVYVNLRVLMDLEGLELRKWSLKFLEVKEPAAPQPLFFGLFEKDQEKVQALEHLIAAKMEFLLFFFISGHSCSLKQEVFV